MRPKDWAAVIEKEYKSFLDGNIDKDEKGKTSRTVVADDGTRKLVLVASWEEGASKYNACVAMLDKPLWDAAPAFEKACQDIHSSKK